MSYVVIEVYGKTFEVETCMVREKNGYLWKNFHNSMLVHSHCQLTWPFMGKHL